MNQGPFTFDELHALVIQWSKDRWIIPNATPTSQLLKAVSEMGELADAANKSDRTGIRDAVGDVLVCIINFCALQGMTVTECLEHAWHEIKDRRGTMLANGCFVKEGDELFANLEKPKSLS